MRKVLLFISGLMTVISLHAQSYSIVIDSRTPIQKQLKKENAIYISTSATVNLNNAYLKERLDYD